MPLSDTLSMSQSAPLDDAAPLSHIPLFTGLDDAERTALFACMRLLKHPANHTVFWLGDRGNSFYLISTGKVAVTVPSEQGEHRVVDVLGPGGFFGEIGLLDAGPRTATVRTTEDSEFYVLGRDDFHAFLGRNPHAAIDILTVMGQRQRASTEALRALSNPNVAFEQTRTTVWQRASDIIARVAAGQWFTLFHLVWFGTWIAINLLGTWGLIPERLAFDPFPFGLLTMVVSLEAIFLSIFVMVSQNRQSEKDRLRVDLDYQVNVKAQTEVMKLVRRLDDIESELHRVHEAVGAKHPAPAPPAPTPAPAPAPAPARRRLDE